MWLYFNSDGQLIKTKEYGNQARVGSTLFDIFAVVEDINKDNIVDYMATIKFFKPDLMNSSYPTLLMTNASAEYKGETDGPFVSGRTYYGFVFKFNEVVDDNSTPDDATDDSHIILLDTDGLWKAMITVVSDGYNVQGIATFTVAGEGTEEPSTVDYDVITTQLVQNINNRALKTQTIATYTYQGIVISLSEYDNGQMFYAKDTHRLYQKIDGELVEISSNFDIDTALSTTSENPVQNKVITTALNNAIVGVYKAKGDETVNNLNSMTKTATMNGYVYNMSNSGYLLNSDQREVSVQEGDNVVFIWNDGEWRWDKLGGSIDTSDLATKSGNNTFSGSNTFGPKTYFNTGIDVGVNKVNFGDTMYVQNSGGNYMVLAQGRSQRMAIGSAVYSYVDFLPGANEQKNLGSSSMRWNTIFGTKVQFGDSEYTNITLYGNTGSLYLQSNTGDIRVNSRIRPTTATCDLGDNNYKWKDGYFSANVYAAEFRGSYFGISGVGAYMKGSLFAPDQNGTKNLGTNGLCWNYVYANYVSDGTNSVAVSDIAQKGSTLIGTYTLTTIDGNAGCWEVPVALLTDGMYMITYGNSQAFVYLTSDMLDASVVTPIRVSMPCVYGSLGESCEGLLRISKPSIDSLTVIFRSVSVAYGKSGINGYQVSIYKTKLA